MPGNNVDLFDLAEGRDPCRGKHGGNRHSQEAWQRGHARAQALAAVILEFIRRQGTAGATSREISAGLAVPLHVTAARLAGLKHEVKIFETDLSRDHCAVVIAMP